MKMSITHILFWKWGLQLAVNNHINIIIFCKKRKIVHCYQKQAKEICNLGPAAPAGWHSTELTFVKLQPNPAQPNSGWLTLFSPRNNDNDNNNNPHQNKSTSCAPRQLIFGNQTR